MRRSLLILWFLIAGPLSAFARDVAPETQAQPEGATGLAQKPAVYADHHMVVAAHPLAATAGLDILRKGGSAIDAAIATQLVLGLVEPQSSGLGGGAFIVHFEGLSANMTAFDGRETAPKAATRDRFLVNGAPMDFPDAVRSSLSVGVPGVMRALELAHNKHGKLSWAELFAPAIALADDGFALPDRLHQLLQLEGAAAFSPGARAYFFDADGRPKAAGTLIKNPDYAATLRALAARGADALHEGPIAEAIIAALAAAPRADGAPAADMTLDDLKSYRAIERQPVCFSYRTRTICGIGPPSSGLLTIAQTLKMIEPMPVVQGADAAMKPAALHAIAEAQKLAYADRNHFIADPNFVGVPEGLLDDGYLVERSKLIDPARAMPPPVHGAPPAAAQRTFGTDGTRERDGTSHISIIDSNDNVVSMTTTIEGAFGSRIWAAGFLLNNELTDFSFRPVGKDGIAVANAVGGGKRPRSSMAPLLIFDKDGLLEGVTGSPGGSRIIQYMAKVLIAILDWSMPADAAAALPNFGSDGGAFSYEPHGLPAETIDALKNLGHTTNAEMMTSGVHTILRRNGRLEGGADPRREGVAVGD